MTPPIVGNPIPDDEESGVRQNVGSVADLAACGLSRELGTSRRCVIRSRHGAGNDADKQV